MRFAGAWLCSVAALSLGACHRPEKAAVPPPPPAASAEAAATIKTNTSADAVAARPAAAGQPSAAATRDAPAKANAPAAPLRSASAAATQGQGQRIVGRGTAATHRRADQGLSADHAACMTAAGGFTVARADCHSAELARQGARLDRAFDAALAARSGEARTRLIEEQRAWRARRDAACREDAAHRTVDLLSEGSCRLDMTLRRAVALEQTRG